MKNILKPIDLADACAEVEMKNNNRLVPAVVTLLGVVVVVISTMLADAENLSTMLLTLGVVVAGVGIVMLIRPGSKLIYRATGERIHRHSYSHPVERKERVMAALNEGKFDLVVSLDARQNAPLMSVIYRTTSGSFCAGQLLHYVPYEYEPLMEPAVSKKK